VFRGIAICLSFQSGKLVGNNSYDHVVPLKLLLYICLSNHAVSLVLELLIWYHLCNSRRRGRAPSACKAWSTQKNYMGMLMEPLRLWICNWIEGQECQDMVCWRCIFCQATCNIASVPWQCNCISMDGPWPCF